eukprot:Rmarinus@m.16722
MSAQPPGGNFGVSHPSTAPSATAQSQIYASQWSQNNPYATQPAPPNLTGMQMHGSGPDQPANVGHQPAKGSQDALDEKLLGFWKKQCEEATATTDFRNHQLPLARIKKIMKSDEDVKVLISQEAPVLFAKACEMFILELTHRAWFHTDENKRRTLQRNDIAAAVSRNQVFDFLIDVLPKEEYDQARKAVLGISAPSSSSSSPAVLTQPHPPKPFSPAPTPYATPTQPQSGVLAQPPGILPSPQPGASSHVPVYPPPAQSQPAMYASGAASYSDQSTTVTPRSTEGPCSHSHFMPHIHPHQQLQQQHQHQHQHIPQQQQYQPATQLPFHRPPQGYADPGSQPFPFHNQNQHPDAYQAYVSQHFHQTSNSPTTTQSPRSTPSMPPALSPQLRLHSTGSPVLSAEGSPSLPLRSSQVGGLSSVIGTIPRSGLTHSPGASQGSPRSSLGGGSPAPSQFSLRGQQAVFPSSGGTNTISDTNLSNQLQHSFGTL